MGKNCARGLEYGPRLKAEILTVFSHTDRPSPVNNIFIFLWGGGDVLFSKWGDNLY